MFNPATGERGGGFPTPPTIGPFSVSMGGEDVVIGSTVPGQDFASSGQNFRATPDVIRPGAGIDGSLKNGISPFPSSSDYFPAVGLELGKYAGPSWPAGFTVTGETSAPYTAPWSIPTGKPKRAYGPRVSIQSFTNVMLTLSYRYPGDPADSYRTYAIFLGKPDLSVTGVNAMKDTSGPALNAADLYSTSRKDVGPVAIRKLDPRTSRFGVLATTRNPPSGQTSPPGAWTDGDFFPKANYVLSATESFSGPLGYTQECPKLFTLLSGGLYPIHKTWQNDQTGAIYADFDGVARPADGYKAGTTAHPMYQTATGAAGARTASDLTRPIILQRPFRSVAELGYVFRDQPWKSLDFFSDKSADAALLDIFCVTDSESNLVAGKINPNRAPEAAIEAVVKGTALDDMDARYPTGAPDIDADTIASAFKTAVGANPIDHRDDLPALVHSNKLTTSVYVAKAAREAPLRALAEVSDFRTWRVLVDLVAQAGKLNGGTNANNFIVEGEHRYWVSLAIDRYTGKVIASNIERITEQ